MDDLVSGYLARIGCAWNGARDLAALQMLQRRCLAAIPYENVDMLQKIPLEFDTEKLWDKLVLRRRGGVCFEMNFLFGDMLRRMGFSVDLLSGMVKGGAGGNFSHVALRVRLPEGDYLADVGYARGYLTPLSLTQPGWQYDGRFRYRLRREGEWMVLSRDVPGRGETEEYRCTLTPREKGQYRAMCDYLCRCPECKFTRILVCTLELSAGRLTLLDHRLLLERSGGTDTLAEHLSPGQKEEILKSRFGLSVSLPGNENET